MQKPEHDIDTAIDRAVRDLMDVDADAAFRARLAARLTRPSRGGSIWLGGALAAAAATLVLAVLVFNRSSLDQRVPSPAANPSQAASSAPAASTPAVVSPGRASRRDPEPVRRARPAAARARRPEPAVSAPPIPRNVIVAAAVGVDDEEPAVEVDDLTDLQPITVVPIQPGGIAADQIVIAPLPITELQVAPLTPRQQRD